jgi:hypothetical protein
MTRLAKGIYQLYILPRHHFIDSQGNPWFSRSSTPDLPERPAYAGEKESGPAEKTRFYDNICDLFSRASVSDGLWDRPCR